MGNPGGGGPGGGGSPPIWAAHTTLINTNKIETTILLFCIIMVYKCIKKLNKQNNYIAKKCSLIVQNIRQNVIILLL